MKILHKLEINCFVKNNEDNFDSEIVSEAIKEKIDSFIKQKLDVEDLNKEKIISKIIILEPEDEYTSKLYQINIQAEKKPEKLLECFFNNKTKKDKINLLKEFNDKIDDEGFLFLRFDKKTFIEKDKLKLVTHGNCIHIKAKIAAFPQNKENALLIMKNYFKINENESN